MSDLLSLADLVEGLSGPDREVDTRIAAALAGAEMEWQAYRDAWAFHRDGHWVSIGEVQPVTASLDAAMTLVPEGDSFTVGQNVHHKHWVASVNYLGDDGAPHSRGDSYSNVSAALALCAASLRARSASADGGE